MQGTRSAESVLLLADGSAEPGLGSYEALCGESRIPDPRKGCPRWPAGLLLRWQRGELTGYVEGRCKGVNVCDYCAVQSAHENARMLSLDALDDPQPLLLAIVGTGRATDDPKPFYAGKREVMRALRGRFGRQVEYVGLVEWTTGKGLRSGGQRRPHWNLFIKGIDPSDLDEARGIVRSKWCGNVPDAEPEAQYVEQLRDVGAAAQYVAMHFHKRDQAPPEGWKGQRFNASVAYFRGRTRAEMRKLARADLQREREIWKVGQAAPDLDLATVLEIAEELLWRHAERTWTLLAVDPIRAERLLAGQSDPPRSPNGHVQPTGSAFSGDLRASERHPKGLGRAAGGQPGDGSDPRSGGQSNAPATPGDPVCDTWTGREGVSHGGRDP